MEWIRNNKKIVIGVLSAVVLVCVGLGIHFISKNNTSEKANKESTEKTVESREDTEEIQDEADTTEDTESETVVDETTQTESDEVSEQTPTETTQPSASTNNTTASNNNTTTSGNTTTSNNNTISGSTTNNGSSNNSGSTTSSNSSNSSTASTPGSSIRSTTDENGYTTYYCNSDDFDICCKIPIKNIVIPAGYYNVVEVPYFSIEPYSSMYGCQYGGYYAVMVHGGEYEKGMKILEDYLATLGYERIGGSGSWIDNLNDQYGVYVDYDEIQEIETEDNIVWG